MDFASAGYFSDGEIISNILKIHAVENPRILDVTYNSGKMWKSLDLVSIKCDINPEYKVDVVSDFMKIPFKDKSFDVIVFDPPHLPTHADSKFSDIGWIKRFGLSSSFSRGRDGDNVIPMFLPFLSEAKRILSDVGLVLCKIADLTHNHKYQWQHVEFINSVLQAGMIACDLIIKVRNNKLTSSKWENVKHFRKNHCYWIVVRNSNKCER